jgi:hypothetical protein
MLAISNEALDWLDRAEQAREVAGQLTDPGASRAVLQVADTFDRLARAAVVRAAVRKRKLTTKSENRTHDFSRPELIPTQSAPQSRTLPATIRLSSSVSSREQFRWIDKAVV